MVKFPLAETNKRPGVHYALTSDGVELPVVDVSHPAFALTVTDPEQRALVQDFLREGLPLGLLPKPLPNLLPSAISPPWIDPCRRHPSISRHLYGWDAHL